MSHNITVEGGSSVRLPTAGKYCDRDIVITATGGGGNKTISLTPYGGSEVGELPFHKMVVVSGQTIILTFYLTKNQGYVYDGRNCGLNYYGSVSSSAYPIKDSELNKEVTLTIKIPESGIISFSGFRNDTASNGELATQAGDRLYGKYITITVVDAGGGGEVTLQSKTVTPTKSTQNVTADVGYTALEKVTVNPIPSNYIDPSGTKTITTNGTHDVNAYEKVSVNVPIPDKYIEPAGTKEITENGTHDVREYASVNVNVATGGGGITADQIATGTIEGNLSISANKVNPYAFYGNGKITEVSAPNVTSLGSYAFYNCGGLTSVYFPNATSAGECAFQSCGIVEIEFPSLLTIPNGCFRYSGKIKKGTFPNATSVGENAFRGDSGLEQLDFSACTTIYQLAFISCTNMKVIIFRSPAVITLKSSNAFSSSPISGGTGYVYVPKALIDAYKTATNWSNYASQFRAIEDYPEICG
jgi:hypothetical protein